MFATALRRSGEYDSATSVYRSLLPLSTNPRDIIERDHIVSGLAVVFLYKGEYDKALESYFESLRLSEQVRDTAGISISLNNIGLFIIKYTIIKKPQPTLHDQLISKKELMISMIFTLRLLTWGYPVRG